MLGLAFEAGQETERVLKMMGCGPLPNTVLSRSGTQVADIGCHCRP